MPVLSVLGVGTLCSPTLFAVFVLVLSGGRISQDGEDHLSLLQGKNFAIQLGESPPDTFAPRADGFAHGPTNATNNISLGEIAAKATASRRGAAGIASKAGNMFNIIYLMPTMAVLGAISVCLMCIIAKYDKVGQIVKDDPLSLYKQSAEALCMDSARSRAPQPSDTPIDLSAPICPTVIMPSCEARFAVPLHALSEVSAEGSFNIMDPLGNPLFCAVVRQAHGGRKLVISMAIPGSTPRASIGPLNGGKGDQLEICGPGNSFFGTLELEKNGTYLVRRGGRTVMEIGGEPKSPRPGLKVLSPEGQPLASINCTLEAHNGVDHLEIRARPNVDSVLILCCVFAVVLLF